jgi:ParB family transcriptional regulator, chromosome partitioning protein
LLLRAKRKEIRKDEPVRCIIGDAETAEQVSLAENVIRVRMHPADEYEAFAFLHDKKGLAAEDIAARFGVHVGLVRQRLKLGAVSPVLMTMYREGKLTLEQMMAFTITDDHARQEQVWEALDWNNNPTAIRRALTEGQVPSTDRRAVLVGAEAYEAAGGAIVRDLFDGEDGGYFTDVALLDRLVASRLEQAAQAVRGEGWHGSWSRRSSTIAPSARHASGLSDRRGHQRQGPAQARQAHPRA